ncbi:sodium-independent anion transporter [Streptomyces guryensis]|uniref:sodium-independent anion transporter n=1 Tax=Streptomyces guryensis TaxID=2886947 RepID=UPI0027E1A753|nr:sodium-independent anion transporter [Streptomyces guryensis]
MADTRRHVPPGLRTLPAYRREWLGAFRNHIMRLTRREPPPVWVLPAAEPVTDVDTTAADESEKLDEALDERGMSLVFAELKDPVRRRIERCELTLTIDPAHFFPTAGGRRRRVPRAPAHGGHPPRTGGRQRRPPWRSRRAAGGATAPHGLRQGRPGGALRACLRQAVGPAPGSGMPSPTVRSVSTTRREP